MNVLEDPRVKELCKYNRAIKMKIIKVLIDSIAEEEVYNAKVAFETEQEELEKK